MASTTETSRAKTVVAFRAEVVVGDDGTVTIPNTTFPAGSRVEVLVMDASATETLPEGSLHGTILKEADPFGLEVSENRYPFRGLKPFRFDRPNDPVGEK